MLAEVEQSGMASALVDLEGVLSLGGIVIRIERAYSRSLKGKARQAVDRLFRSWDLGLSLGADGVLRSVIQHQRESASYAFAGSAPSLMSRLFEDPSAPLLEQAVTVRLGPLPAGQVGDYLTDRFQATGKEPGQALDPLLRFCRGHPQRLMPLAHQLWRHTPDGATADEETWLQAREAALDQTERVLHATYSALPTNEQRVATALSLSPGKPGDADIRALVGIGKGSVHAALRQLRGRGDVIDTPDGPRITDPLLELWLRERMEA